ncbi:hypothetical protein Goarm_023129, partial [Gossypium armourianum]|nr:hypothetical protein [Gossypium armourianum]
MYAGKRVRVDSSDVRSSYLHGSIVTSRRLIVWVFFENYLPLKEIIATPRRDNILEEKWMAILQNLQEEDIEIWGAVGYALLLVLRQYRSRQFIPTTHGIAECEFSYKGDGYKKKIRWMSNA